MKKILVLALIAALLIGVLAGCGSSASTSDYAAEEPEAAAEAPAAAPEAPAGPEAPAAEPAPPVEEAPADEAAYFPLAESEEISIWMSYPPIFAGLADSGPADFAFYKEAQRLTNVDIEWDTASFIDARTAITVLLAGGDYPDIIWGLSAYYAGSLDGAIEEGILIDHKPYIEQYMPYMKALFDSAGDVYWKDITTDAGNIPFISMCNPVGEVLDTGGWVVNLDMLSDAGIDTDPREIRTLDQWDEIAAAMQDAGYDHPIWVPYQGYYYGSSIGAAFGTSITFQERAGQYAPFYYNENREVCFGGVGEGFRNYLELMHGWYEKGYIDPDFISKNETDQYPTEEDIVNRNTAFFTTNNNYINYNAYKGTPEEVRLSAIPDPVLTPGQQLTIGEPSMTVTSIGSGSVTTGCDPEKYELVFHWFDWFFGPEGYVLTNYGVENESFEYDADGNPHFTDAILAPELYSQNTVISYYTGGGTLNCGVANYAKYNDLYNDLQKESCEIWASAGQNSDDMLSQYISLTDDELDVYSAAMADIITYISENTVKFINGERSLDEYSDYEQVIYDRGIEDVIAIMAAAQARYDAR